MAVPPVGATGLDKSDPATFGAGVGFLAPSSMGASEGFRDELSAVALDRPQTAGDMDPESAGPAILDEAMALDLLRDASSQSRSFFESHVHSPWQRNYRAVRNEHFAGSLYLSDAYKTRSKIFKPKTRSAVHKRIAARAKAMFAPGNVVSVEAEDATNPQQVASAALKQEVLNYRLSTPTLRNGIPWFLTAMGASFDAEVTSICCSKQFWNYKEQAGADGKMQVLIDKPDVMLIPPENVRFDPNCNWTNVAQLSPYVLLQFAMTPGEAWDMIQSNQRARVPWRQNLTEADFKNKAGATPSETTAPRSAREGGRDPKQQSSGAFKPVWLTEVFMRYQGRDYVYWAMNDEMILSDPAPVEQVYPWCFGERPVAIGMGQLEPHRTYQMSMVESIQGLQQEANDLTNLRLDWEKRIVAPPMSVLRGKKVDLSQVQRKGANSILMVNAHDDVQVMQLPEIPNSLFNETNMLDADMNDLTGVIDGSGTSAKDAANDTLGGMHLLAESGNSVSDFDMALWSETWAQPVMIQLLRLEEYYETDEKVLAIAGQRGKLWERYGVSEITDEFLRAETTVKVNLGVGATSLPMEKLKRFSIAWDTAAKALAPFVQTKVIDVTPNAEAIVESIFHAGGFADGGKQFFEYIGPAQQPPGPPPADPKAQAALLAAQAKMQGNQIAQEKNQGQMMLQAHDLEERKFQTRAQLMNDAQDRKTGLDIAHMKAVAEMERSQRADHAASAAQAFDHVHDHHKQMMSPFLTALAQHLAPKDPMADQKAANSPHGDPSRPMLAPKPSPHAQPQPGMFATL